MYILYNYNVNMYLFLSKYKNFKFIVHKTKNLCYNAFCNWHGGIAQLGERLNGIQEVMGSNPTISIKSPYILRVFVILQRIAPYGANSPQGPAAPKRQRGYPKAACRRQNILRGPAFLQSIHSRGMIHIPLDMAYFKSMWKRKPDAFLLPGPPVLFDMPI